MIDRKFFGEQSNADLIYKQKAFFPYTLTQINLVLFCDNQLFQTTEQLQVLPKAMTQKTTRNQENMYLRCLIQSCYSLYSLTLDNLIALSLKAQVSYRSIFINYF